MQFYIKNGVQPGRSDISFETKLLRIPPFVLRLDVPEAQSVSNFEAHSKSLFANWRGVAMA